MTETAPRAIRFYTEEELDALEMSDPDAAYRIARAQAMAQHSERRSAPASNEPPDPAAVREAVDTVRRILARDGGDIDLVAIEDRVVRVRMKGACAGCPNSVLDLRNVVEKVVGAVPGVQAVVNAY